MSSDQGGVSLKLSSARALAKGGLRQCAKSTGGFHRGAVLEMPCGCSLAEALFDLFVSWGHLTATLIQRIVAAAVDNVRGSGQRASARLMVEEV